MALKLPPPPQLPVSFGGFGQQLNRWLLEIQSILNSQGLIDPDEVQGLPALFTQVATLAGEVATLTTQVATLTTQVATNTANIATNTANIATNAANIATLTARNQILNGSGVPASGLGNNGDLYINDTGGVGSYLYGKIAGVWVAFA
jgi:hypothetical protein